MTYAKPKLVVSTVGIGLVTNKLEKEDRELINSHTNISQKVPLPPGVQNVLTSGKLLTSDRLERHEYSKIAAELSALAHVFGWHDGQAPVLQGGDEIKLITTDTHVGHACVDTIVEYFDRQGISVSRIVSKGLQTSDSAELQVALADLTKQLSEIVDMYQASHEIIFNLTGGFKAISAYLQQTATLLGVTSCYLFEQSSSLIYIPKVPITLDLQLFVGNVNIQTMRQIALELPIHDEQAANDLFNRAGVFFLDKNIMEGYYLSAWGVVVWQKIRQHIYGQNLLEMPVDTIVFSNRNQLEKNIRNLNRYEDINDTIDVLAKWHAHQTEPLQSHKIKYINNDVAQYEIYAWNDGSAGRLFFNKLANGTLEVLPRVDHL